MIDYAKILSKKYPESQWTLDGWDYQGLTWLSNTTKPSKEELDNLAEIVDLEIEADRLNSIKRKEEILGRLSLTAEELEFLLS